MDGVANEMEETVPFLSTGCSDGPDALTPLPSSYAPRPPSDEPIDHTVGDRPASFANVLTDFSSFSIRASKSSDRTRSHTEKMVASKTLTSSSKRVMLRNVGVSNARRIWAEGS